MPGAFQYKPKFVDIRVRPPKPGEEAQAFAGTPKVARQRMVYRALAEELAGPVHALSVKALAPGEGA